MSITVRIPTQLRTLTDGAAEVDGTGDTVSHLLRNLDRSHPGLSHRLLDDDGRLRRFVNIYLDDEDIRFLDGLETQVHEPAKVTIIPAVAGG